MIFINYLNKEKTEIMRKMGINVQTDTKIEKGAKRVENHCQNNTNHHNSFQHDQVISVPLLSILLESLKKENKDNDEEKKGLEIIAEEVTDDEDTEKKKKAKDAIVALADRIKRLYAQELIEGAYGKAVHGYNPNAQYQNERTTQTSNMIKPSYEQEEYSNTEKLKPKEIKDENSNYSKLAGGGKYQAFIMTDPRGRLHGRWDIERVMNETYDGKLERNDGLHGQWL